MAYEVTAEVTFYAQTSGAFEQLAPLLAGSASFGPGRVELGGPLDADVTPGVRGLADHTKVNYAIGVLLARGLTFIQAESYLNQLEERYGSLEDGAEHVLNSFDT